MTSKQRHLRLFAQRIMDILCHCPCDENELHELLQVYESVDYINNHLHLTLTNLLRLHKVKIAGWTDKASGSEQVFALPAVDKNRLRVGPII